MSTAERKKRWLALTLLVVLASFGVVGILGLHDYVYGPSAENAFRRYIKDPIPESVTDLQIHYRPHMRGYWIYLVFRVDPGDLDSLFDFGEFQPSQSYAVDEHGFLVFPQLEPFREIDPDGFNAMRKGEHLFYDNTDEASPLRCAVVISVDRRKVYYYRFRD